MSVNICPKILHAEASMYELWILERRSASERIRKARKQPQGQGFGYKVGILEGIRWLFSLLPATTHVVRFEGENFCFDDVLEQISILKVLNIVQIVWKKHPSTPTQSSSGISYS